VISELLWKLLKNPFICVSFSFKILGNNASLTWRSFVIETNKKHNEASGSRKKRQRSNCFRSLCFSMQWIALDISGCFTLTSSISRLEEQSSSQGWYWRVEEECTDENILMDNLKRLTGVEFLFVNRDYRVWYLFVYVQLVRSRTVNLSRNEALELLNSSSPL